MDCMKKTMDCAGKQLGAIVDLDGTLLNSVEYWDRLPYEYIRSKGLEPPANIRKEVFEMEVGESAAYIKQRMGLSEDASQIKQELVEMIRSVYTEKAQFYPGAEGFLRELHAKGVRMALFSATERSCVEACLKRLGVLDLFHCVVSTMDIGMDKSVPEAFLNVLERLGTAIENTTVYEDASYAIAGARKAGFKNIITLEH
jgi:HAD superfamily hydrolase (TIGR01509 family)